MDINDLLDMINQKEETSVEEESNEQEDTNESKGQKAAQRNDQRDASGEENKENQIDPRAFESVMNAVDGVKYNSIVQMEVKDFFDKNPQFSKEPSKSTILNTAFNIVKQGLSKGQTIPIGAALGKSSEYYKGQVVNHLNASQEMLNQMVVKKNTGIDDFKEKVKNYTMDDFLRDYDKDILPSMTVQGLHSIHVEKGYGRENETIRDGTATHKQPQAKTQ